MKEVLHFYLGAKRPIQLLISNCSTKMQDAGFTSGIHSLTIYLYESIMSGDCTAKPILRPISNIMEKEARHIHTMNNRLDTYIGFTHVNDFIIVNTSLHYEGREGKIPSKYVIHPHGDYGLNSKEFVYLLRHGFDLFNLINNGSAIDATTIKQ